MSQEPVAIIGAGCRFSGDSSRPSKLWQLLKEPRNVASGIPSERFNLKSFFHPEGTRHGSTNVPESYFIDSSDIRHFDAQFFNFPNTEADPMDPQHRQLLEVVYESLEDAGMTIEEKQGSDTAVFVGLMCNDYSTILTRDYDYIPKYAVTGLAASNASSRVSYFFDWHGACMTIDTACSSSLIALHQAVQALRSGASSMAIAAGTNLLIDPLPYVSLSNLSMLSPTGRSRMWDSEADGYARGDGVAAVVLKTLSRALADGDTVDCIIRETGANHDGRTPGITMPSGIAQTALINDTYARAGLDPLNRLERCQYFEAHGTGTPAGDPQEASALDAAFFNGKKEQGDEPLYVGSVKTVIGHTEGTAGIAGLLKAYLAIKNGTIPPNLLFNKLSPVVEPFYANLNILTQARPWPVLPPGVPRRASVNSFGFGGSNAHAVLEGYDRTLAKDPIKEEKSSLSIMPFLFSAHSESALKARIKSFGTFLQDDTSIDLDDLRYTLACKRSVMAFRAALVASSSHGLVSAIETALADDTAPIGATSSNKERGGILGVFTGQGAQWPKMGSTLIATYPSARKTIDELDHYLASLEDKPIWTILEQLSLEADCSRVGEAAISQPLCTAVQILLVNLLYDAGVSFKAVVGHSSGEIGAAYAAGLLSASDAIRIAYYRGQCAGLACGTDGSKGAMLAVGTSPEDAQELCSLEDLEGRISVAASNSSSSVTLSGDADAIEEARLALEQEGKFARLLKVDTAYHSHHMQPCVAAYIKALTACNIQILEPPKTAPAWYSSVVQGRVMSPNCQDLAGQYWVANMTNPVLFSQAIEATVASASPFSLGVEVGPHPALKGPATQTMQEKTGSLIAYTGTLNRGHDDVKALAASLGQTWANLGSSAVNWKSLLQVYCQDTSKRSMVKDLPLYQWDHTRLYWAESRMGRLLRTQDYAIHTLLGQRIPDGTALEVRWKNLLKPREIPWLADHALQGQIVFPGTGYVCLAMEASMELAAGRSVQIIELTDLSISKAIAIDETIGTEVVVSMTNIIESENDGDGIIQARFTSYSTVGAAREATELVVNAQGDVRIVLGEPIASALTPRHQYTGRMSDVDVAQFYDAMKELGYGYSGAFRGLESIQRRLDYASGTINRPPIEENQQLSRSPLLFHPGMLDTALQSLFAAFSAPGDGRLSSMIVPTAIRRVSLVPALCGAIMPELVTFDSNTIASRPLHVVGNVDIIAADGLQKCIEIDGLGFVPFTAATAAHDRNLFSKVTWGIGQPDGDAAVEGIRATADDNQKAKYMERVAIFYLQRLTKVMTPQEKADPGLTPHHKALLNMAEYQVARFSKNPQKKAWLTDEQPVIEDIISRYEETDADFAIMKAVGENLPAVIRGQVTILEVMTKDGKLDAFYESALGYPLANRSIANMVGQVAYRFPNMDILEIGAGTGGATRAILKNLGTAFGSYTYTDISTGFFQKARQELRQYAGKMTFKTLDITKDTSSQGYKAGCYDVLIASNVLHATAPLQEALWNARGLLRPGGYLILLEIVDPSAIAVGLTMGGLPGWWVGVDDGRVIAPTMTLKDWNLTLRKCGFSGVDSHTPMKDPQTFVTSVFAAQAVDEQVNLYRRPMMSRPDQIPIKDLILIGGDSMATLDIVEDLRALLEPRTESCTVLANLDELTEQVPTGASILCLADVDSPTFKDLTEERWVAIKSLICDAGVSLWVANGSHCREPFNGAMLGLWRSIPYEVQQLRSQFLDVTDLKDLNATVLAERFLHLHIGSMWLSSSTPLSILWKPEPELRLHNGSLEIQRVMYDVEANARYNSAKRIIIEEIDPREDHVSLEYIAEDGRYTLHKVRAPRQDEAQPHVTVVVHSSLLFAIRTSAGLLSLSMGFRLDNGVPVLAASTVNSSRLVIPESFTIPVKQQDSMSLRAAACFLFCQQIKARLHFGSCLLVHEPDPMLASMLRKVLKGTVSNLVCTTTDQNMKQQEEWTVLHPAMARSGLLRSLPAGVDLFLDLSHSVHGRRPGLGRRIRGTLPVFCEVASLDNLVARSISPLSETGISKVADVMHSLETFLANQDSPTPRNDPVPTLDAAQVAELVNATDMFSILDWHHNATVPAALEPVDWRKDLFQPGKTYWMIGLANDLGQSLVDWMIGHGATSVVVSSRNPKIDDSWIDICADRGADVRCIAADIANMDSLRDARNQIEASMPPIAGVSNGALILRDKIFINTTFEDLQDVLKPKITGTANLGELFGDDSRLDWFICFSSIVATTGNTGQSAYSAANCYMKAMMQQRRANGLVGSTIDISRVHGVGYVEREAKAGRALTAREIGKIHRVTMPMCESDLHQLFAEAVQSGTPTSDRQGEIITGIRTLSGEITDVYWAANAKFGHFIQTLGSGDDVQERFAVRVNVKAHLANVRTMAEASVIVKAAFVARLCLSLQMEEAHLSDTTPLVDFGIDSLVAVEVRTWFQVELGVDMPILKVLQGASASDLVDDAMNRLPEEIRAQLEEADASANMSAPPVVVMDISGESASTAPSEASVAESRDKGTVSPLTDMGTGTITSAHVLATGYFNAKHINGKDNGLDTKSETKIDDNIPAIRPFQPEILRREPMSYTQSRFWFLAKTVDMIVNRHEALRTCFFSGNDKDNTNTAYQGIMRKSAIQLEHIKVKNLDQVRHTYQLVRNHIYNLEKGDTMRLLLCDGDNDTHLVVGYHHIAMDGGSWEVVFQELQQGYLQGFLPNPKRQYADWSAKQRETVTNGRMASERAFWKREFAALPPVLPLLHTAQVKARRPLRDYGIRRKSIKLDARVNRLVKEQSKTAKVSIFHFHLAVYRTLLCHLADTGDVCIGMADSNRMTDAADAGVVGVLLNLLPLRFKGFETQLTLAAALNEARTRAFGALANSVVPFNVILDDASVQRTSSYNPLFQAFIEYRAAQPFNKEMEPEQTDNATSYSKTAYDITMNIFEDHAGETIVSFGVQSELYGDDTADMLLRMYIQQLAAFAERPLTTLVENMSPYSEAELDRALRLGAGASLATTWPETLVHRIDQMAVRYSNNIAVKDTSGLTMSYTEMASKVKGLCGKLRTANVTPGCAVGVFQQPSVAWICSMLAILRVGACYVPLDLRQGEGRLAAIAQACRPAAVFVDSMTRQGEIVFGCKAINVDDVIAPESGSLSDVAIAATRITAAVLLFTSGTTGLPKGIVLSHGGLSNAVEGLTTKFDLDRERVLQQTAFSFDMSLDEIFVALCTGGTLVVVDRTLRGDSLAIMGTILDENITYTRATPPEYSSWIRHGGDLVRSTANAWRFAFAGGDRMADSLRKEFRSLQLPGLRLFNSYGPTEISLSAVKLEIPYQDDSELSNDQIPVGKPMPNYNIYTVDSRMQLLPIGMPGEILIGGAGVSGGYLNDASKTRASFFENKWATETHKRLGHTKLYKTGDYGYLNQNGAVVFLGRIAGDTQIKLRGNRVELGDIESNIISHSRGRLQSVLCTLRGSSVSQFIVGHVVFSADNEMSTSNQRHYLAKLVASLPMPNYMKPMILVPLSSFPLTVHQKIDRAAVAALSVDVQAAAADPEDNEVRQLTATEEKIRDLWSTVVSAADTVNTCGHSADFFRLGGNSLLLVELSARIRATFNVWVPLVELLEGSTLGKMAAMVDQQLKQGAVINWEEETDVPIVILPGNTSPLRQHGLEILVTGATGHIGRHVLPYLLASDQVSRVHCVAVRNPDNVKPDEKLMVHEGDLTLPHFGLSEAEMTQLSNSVDVILHLAAMRSFWEPYQVVRETNVVPIKELIEIAAPRKVPIHFMSSGAVSKDGRPQSARDAAPSPNDPDGYVSSKWASERLLERSAEQYNFPVHIYRTMPSSSSTRSLPKDLVEDFATAVLRTGAMIDDSSGQWSGSFDLISAHEVSAVLHRSLTTSPPPGTRNSGKR
ncbi:hypothetical protein NHJ13734_008859 [Beauveria thailandica]